MKNCQNCQRGALIFGLIFKNEDYGVLVMLIPAAIGTIIAFGGMGWASINKIEDYVKYDVLVSEDVAFQEFYNKYEFLEAKGQVYTVKEIELDVYRGNYSCY